MLEKLYYDHLVNRPKGFRSKNVFHPSSIHLPAKELYKRYFGGDQTPFPPNVLALFELGHWVHEKLQGTFKEMGILIADEVRVRHKELQISGSADGIVDIPMPDGTKKRGVLEIKTMSLTAFFTEPEKPKREHLWQLNCYMMCLGIDRGVLLYYCKDNSQMRCHYVKADKVIQREIVEKLVYVLACIKEGVEPE